MTQKTQKRLIAIVALIMLAGLILGIVMPIASVSNY